MDLSLRKRDKRNHDHLIGRIIPWVSTELDGGIIHYVVVAGIDYDMGFSLVNPENPTDLFSCHHGKYYPKLSNYSGKGIYNIEFAYVLNCIRNNRTFDTEELENIIEEEGYNLHKVSGRLICAFM